MRSVKGFLFVITGLAILILAVSAVMPSQVMTVRTVSIHAPHDTVMQEIADLRNWKHWHPVFMQDSNTVEVSSAPSGANAYLKWTSNGHPNKLLIQSASSNAVKIILGREGEKDVENIIAVTEEPNNNAVQVEWKVVTRLKWYPWEKFAGIFIDKLTGPGYEAALNNLKNITEHH